MDLSLKPIIAYPESSPEYADSLSHLLARIFTIPLLPNRLPIDALPRFTASLPLRNLQTVRLPTILNCTTEDKIHLAANLHMFVSPHYSLLPPPALQTYLKLSACLLNAFPPSLLNPPGKEKKRADAYDSEDDVRVSVVSSFEIPLSVPKIDDKTLKRLQSIISIQHITTLINAAQSRSNLFPDLVSYLFSLTLAWSTLNSQIYHTVLASTGGAFVRELYRGLVRTCPLGREESHATLIDPVNVSYYPPLLFLVDLYSQALLTMGDDEFFGTSPAGGSGRAQRNPLSLDELISFSRQLINIAFALYWRDDAGGPLSETYISREVRCTWEAVREKVTRCLLGIHARE